MVLVVLCVHGDMAIAIENDRHKGGEIQTLPFSDQTSAWTRLRTLESK